MTEKIAVIGGGPAGILAAGTAASRNKEVVLFEKNNKLGKKLLITGGGRCNVTNNCEIQELIENTSTNKEFLYSAFYTFSNTDLINLLNRYGLKTKVEVKNKVFPITDNANDVLKVLVKHLKEYGVNIKLNQEIKDIKVDDDGKFILLCNNERLKFDKVIIATGGKSYQHTGSTGDGYFFAKRLGHTVTKLKPALVPIEIKEDWIKELQGISLNNVKLISYLKGKKIYEEIGELIFTHYGISGPIVLLTSNYINNYNNEEIKFKLDLKPELNKEELENLINIRLNKFPRKEIKNSIIDLLPNRLLSTILRLADVNSEKLSNQVTRVERKGIISVIKGIDMTFKGLRPISEAMVTSGGVSVNEINPSTMESKKVKGLFFAGEVIDVDAITGGFNLQIAFSTGYLAGISC